MPATLNDQKRTAIAEKLADIRAIQHLIIDSEQQFLSECNDNHLRNRLEDMLEDDQKNLDIVETAITQYGIQAEPKPTVQEFVSQAKNTLASSRLSMYEKIAQHELLKHGQVMSGLVVHKAAQVVGQDIEAAIAPLNTVNFENRAHQEQLKGMLEYLGTLELTGQEPQQGLWARVQDAVAAATGIVGSATTQTSDKESATVMDLLFMDHQKARTIISEIRNADSADQIKALFGQLYTDLVVHAKAEEAVVYPAVEPFYGDEDTQELYDETAEVESVLNELKAMPSTGDQFMAKLKELKAMLGHHTREEESTMFAAIRKNMSSEEQQQLGMRFKESKQSLQNQM